MVKIDEITEIEIKDGILTIIQFDNISQFDNNKVILNQSSLNAINEAINYTHCCTELCDCEIPKPKDPYNDIDKNYCRDCENLIA